MDMKNINLINTGQQYTQLNNNIKRPAEPDDLKENPIASAGAAVKDPYGYIDPNSTDFELKHQGYSNEQIRELKKTGKVNCTACSERKYVDGSNDPGVSFKTPQKMNPAQAATAVLSHENEHVARNDAKAKREGREVVESNVRVFSDICAECGKSYISGGETRTVTKKKEESQSFADKFYEEKIAKGIGNELDTIL